jgi:hypothetical protein
VLLVDQAPALLKRVSLFICVKFLLELGLVFVENSFRPRVVLDFVAFRPADTLLGYQFMFSGGEIKNLAPFKRSPVPERIDMFFL